MNYKDKWITSRNKFIATVKDTFESNLDLIIMQAYEDDKVIDDWSDLDFFIVFRKVDFRAQKEISRIKANIEEEYGIHMGSTVLSCKEFDYEIGSLCPLKINLMKLGLCNSGNIIKKHELIYGERKSFKFNAASTDKESFLREISFFRSYIRNLIRDKAILDGNDLIRPVIKTSKYIILCSLLHSSLDYINNYRSLYDASVQIFEDFKGDLNQIKDTENKKFEVTKMHSDLFFNTALNFLEDFTDYYFDKCINKQE